LHQYDKSLPLEGDLRGFIQPGEDQGHARRVLRMPHIVVAAGDVQRDEHPALGFPAQVLAKIAGLPLHLERFLEAEQAAPRAQALERVLAVGPLVVARQQHERMANARELLFSLREPAIRARLRARADVAEVHHERELLRVQLVDEALDAMDLVVGIGNVAEDAERLAVPAGRRRGTAR
jgi:hypothetical protein